jgi:nucleoside-diphosphate-sugar epimerase
MKILITGVSGLLGNLVARRLIAQKYHVRALLRDHTKAERIRNLGAELVFGDMEFENSLAQTAEGMDVVIHCAGLVGSGRSSNEQYWSANTDGTRYMLAEARRAGVKRFVFLSTVGVYGLNSLRPNLDESTPRRTSGNGYSDSKIAAEELVESAGMEYVILRPYWITGGGDRFLIPQVARLLQAGEFRYIGDGKQRWSLSVAENISDAVGLVATHPQAVNKIYNVADVTIPISETIEVIAEALKLPAPTRKASALEVAWRSLLNKKESNPARMGIDLFFPLWRGITISSERIRSELGWAPQTPWQTSLRQGVQEWLSHTPHTETV